MEIEKTPVVFDADGKAVLILVLVEVSRGDVFHILLPRLICCRLNPCFSGS